MEQISPYAFQIQCLEIVEILIQSFLYLGPAETAASTGVRK